MFLLCFILTLTLMETNAWQGLGCPTGDCKVCDKHEDCEFIEYCNFDIPGPPDSG